VRCGTKGAEDSRSHNPGDRRKNKNAVAAKWR